MPGGESENSQMNFAEFKRCFAEDEEGEQGSSPGKAEPEDTNTNGHASIVFDPLQVTHAKPSIAIAVGDIGNFELCLTQGPPKMRARHDWPAEKQCFEHRYGTSQ